MRRRVLLALWGIAFWVLFNALVFLGARIVAMRVASPDDLAWRVTGIVTRWCFFIGAALAILFITWVSKSGVLPGTKKKEEVDPEQRN